MIYDRRGKSGVNVKVLALTIVNLFCKNFGLPLMAFHSYLWRRESMQVILLWRRESMQVILLNHMIICRQAGNFADKRGRCPVLGGEAFL